MNLSKLEENNLFLKKMRKPKRQQKLDTDFNRSELLQSVSRFVPVLTPRRASLATMEQLFECGLKADTPFVVQQLKQTYAAANKLFDRPVALIVPPLDIVPASFDILLETQRVSEKVLRLWGTRTKHDIPIVMCSADLVKMHSFNHPLSDFPEEWQYKLILFKNAFTEDGSKTID